MSSVLWAVEIAGDPVVDVVVENVTVSYGRQNVWQTVAPTACTLTVLTDSPLGAFDPATAAIGQYVQIDGYSSSPYVLATHFVGKITDVTVVEHLAQITAVAVPLAAWGRYTATAVTAIPADTLTGAAITLLNAEIAPGFDEQFVTIAAGTQTVQLAAAAAVNALELAQLVASSEPAGVIYEYAQTNAIVLGFADAETRRVSGASTFTFAAGELDRSWAFVRRISSKVNSAVVDWYAGTAFVDDPVDVLANGVYQLTLGTALDNELDAITAASTVIAHQKDPGWEIESIKVIGPTLSLARQLALLQAKVGDTVTLPSLGAGFPTAFFLEGWTTTIRRNVWECDLYLSDQTLTRPADRWLDVPIGEKWNTLSPSLTWDEALKEPVI
jgi:hypothetical protein